MAVISTIKPSTGNYTTLTAWEADKQGVLTDVQVAECYAFTGGLNDKLVIDGSTTNDDYYFVIRCAVGEGHEGKWDSTKFYMAPSTDGDCFELIDSDCVIEGLQLYPLGSSSLSRGFLFSTYDQHVSSCIIDGHGSSYCVGIEAGTNVGHYVFSNIVYDCNHSDGSINASYGNFVNNTVYSNSGGSTVYGFTGHTSAYIYNNLAFGFDNGNDYASAFTDEDYNGTDQSSANSGTGGTNSVFDLVAADEFVNVTAGSEDFQLKTGASSIDQGEYGTRVPPPCVVDIVGNPRFVSFDLGASEFPNAGYPTIESVSIAKNISAETTLTIPAPVGVEDGDYLLIVISKDDNPLPTAPTGDGTWTNHADEQGDSDHNLSVWGRFADASEPTSYAFTTDSEQSVAKCYRISNVDTTNPVQVGTGNFTTTSTPQATGITTAEADMFVLAICGTDDDDTPFSITTADWVEDINDSGGDGNGACGLIIGRKLFPTASTATGAVNFQQGATEEANCIQIGIRPAAAAQTIVTPNDSTHAHSADSPVLQAPPIPNDSTHAHTADNVVLESVVTVTPNDSLHSHTADSPTLQVELAVNDSTHAHTADNVVLEVFVTVTPNDSTHSHSADSPALQAPPIPNDSTHAHTADEPELSVSLLVAESTHSHSTDAITLQVDPVPNDSTHDHLADNVVLETNVVVTPNDSTHGHSAESPTLQVSLLVNDSAHNHTADSPTLQVELAVNDSTHGHTADNVVLTFEATYSTDFTEYTINSQLSDWKDFWSSGSSFKAQYSTGSPVFGDRCLDLIVTTSARHAVTWEDIGTPADVDILANIYIDGTYSGTNGPRLYARLSGEASTENGYAVEIRGDTANEIALFKYVTGTSSAIGTPVPTEITKGGSYWMRFRVNGTSLKFKIWEHENVEPDQWLIEETDSSLTSGTVGLGTYSSGCNFECDYFSCKTGGLAHSFPPADWDYANRFGSFNVATGNGLVNTVIMMGGTFPSLYRKLQEMAVYVGTTHSSQVRCAVYSGGSIASGPQGATLLYDFGLTSGSLTSTFLTLTGADVEIPEGEVLWLGVKGNDAGFAVRYTSYDGNSGNFEVTNAGSYNITAGISSDETVAWPSTIPAITGSYGVNTHIMLVDSYEPPTVYPNGSLHGHAAESPEPQANLTVSECLHGHTSDSPALQVSLLVNDSVHGHTAESPSLQVTVSPNECLHGHTAESPTLVTGLELYADDSLHGHTSDQITIVPILSPSEALHGHLADNVILDTGLDVQDAQHAHTADNVQVQYSPRPDDCLHVLKSDHIWMSVGRGYVHAYFTSLAPRCDFDSIAPRVTMVSKAPTIVFSQGYRELVNATGGTHGHSADNVDLDAPQVIGDCDSIHAHFADNVGLIPTAYPDDSTHGHSAETPTLVV